MSTLADYRRLVPGHARVPDASVQVWLDQAVDGHTYSAWGTAYDLAMVAWAAAHVEPLRVAGQAGELTPDGALCGPTTAADGAPVTPPAIEETVYWGWYLERQRSRAARGPLRVGVE